MANVTFIEHQGEKIVYINFGGVNLTKVSIEELNDITKDTHNYIITQPLKSVLLLINLTNFNLNLNELHLFSQLASEETPHIKASAVYGLSGIIQSTFMMFNKNHHTNVKIFETQQEALDWLASVNLII